VVIGDLNLMCTVSLPDKANSELIVDSDAVLSRSISLKRFQPVARRNAKIVESEAGLYLIEFAKRHGRDSRPAAARASFKEELRIRVIEALDH
jgi:hypothetical protein